MRYQGIIIMVIKPFFSLKKKFMFCKFLMKKLISNQIQVQLTFYLDIQAFLLLKNLFKIMFQIFVLKIMNPFKNYLFLDFFYKLSVISICIANCLK